jgi:hypothetical protein
MKKIPVLHTLLFSILPILFLFDQNKDQVIFFDILFPMATSFSFGILFTLLLGWRLKDSTKAGIVVSVFYILFFSLGNVFNLLEFYRIGNVSIGRFRYLMPVWVILFIGSAVFIIKTRKSLYGLVKVLNIYTLFLFFFLMIKISAYEFNLEIRQKGNQVIEIKENNKSALANVAVSPDIYYIVLDAYASSTTLKDIYGYDNNQFTDYLVKKKFFITSKSRSNYAMTFLSLTSSLNMDYINCNMTDMTGLDNIDQKVHYRMIKNNRVMSFLKSKGYQFINISTWGPTIDNKFADMNFHFSDTWNDFTVSLIQTTFLRPFTDHFKTFENNKREKILYAFSKLADINKIEGPKFIFAHILCPHSPYVFGQNGELVLEATHQREEIISNEKDKYLNQLIFVNKKIEILIDEILSNSTIDPIVIFQGDHGPSSSFSLPEQVGWANPTKINLKERMGIFNAYHLPKGGDAFLYDSISPVNSFRLIFNFYFHEDFKMLNDRSYYSTYECPYKFIDVTDKVK